MKLPALHGRARSAKVTWYSLVILIPLLFPSQASASTHAITTSTVHVRDGPSTMTGVIATLPAGTKVDILEKEGNGWARIRTSSLTGFVYGKYLRINKDSSIWKGLRSFNDYFLLFACFILPLLWIVLTSYGRLTLRGQVFAIVVFVLVPALTVIRLIYGSAVILETNIFKDCDAILKVAGLALAGALVVKVVVAPRPQTVIVLMLVIGLEAFSSKMQPLGSFMMVMVSTTMGFDEVVLELLNGRKMDRYISRFVHD